MYINIVISKNCKLTQIFKIKLKSVHFYVPFFCSFHCVLNENTFVLVNLLPISGSGYARTKMFSVSGVRSIW